VIDLLRVFLFILTSVHLLVHLFYGPRNVLAEQPAVLRTLDFEIFGPRARLGFYQIGALKPYIAVEVIKWTVGSDLAPKNPYSETGIMSWFD
jgi:hypothetical protein